MRAFSPSCWSSTARAFRCWRRRASFVQFEASNEAIDRLLQVARQEFDNVVVDVGSRLDLTGTALFKERQRSTW